MFLKHLEISQLGAIDRLALDFSLAQSSRVGGPARNASNLRLRTVLIGENGCGKSTALRAIALVMAGSQALRELVQSPARWVRQGQKEARIQAVVTDPKGAECEISLTLRPEWQPRQTLAKNAASLSALDTVLANSAGDYLTLAYGVNRRPVARAALNSAAARRGPAQARAGAMATLFSPDAALIPMGRWAFATDHEATSGKAAAADSGVAALRLALKKLLPGVTLEGIDPEFGELRFKTVDGTLAFAQLSLAHQTQVNWFADVLYRIGASVEAGVSPLKARGVLLIDEIDLHLHPARQRLLLDAIGAVLPHMQLIATTHSPLLAQQLRPQELVVLARPTPKSGTVARVVQGDPSQLTLSQMLSPLFGIDTGDSVRIAALRAKARARGGALAGHEIEELAQLAPVDSLPTAMREQLRASAELTDAVSRASGAKGAPPQLDLEKLRLKMGERIRTAALRPQAPT